MAAIDYRKFFPFPEIRDQQIQALDFIFETFSSGKKFAIIEAPTGVGKSAIAITVARYYNDLFKTEEFSGSYFLTTQKILQEQYARDFGSPNGCMASLRSSSNYNCGYHTNLSCKESRLMLKGEPYNSQFSNACLLECPYIKDKHKFMNSRESVTSYAYFLNGTIHNPKAFDVRSILVIDEAHNIEEQVSNNYELHIAEMFSEKVLELKFDNKIISQDEAFKWIKEFYYPKVQEQEDHIREMFNKFFSLKEPSPQLAGVAKKYDLIMKHGQKIKKFVELYNEDNWAYNFIPAFGKQKRKYEFKPVDISHYVNEVLFKFGDRVILMSATILNKEAFCESLGIKEIEAGFLSLESSFPVQNRPVYYMPSGKMSKNNIDSSLPRLLETIKELMKVHKEHKGIIHTHTYKIADYIRKNYKSSRLLFHDADNKEVVLQEHLNSSKATVLVSPSMMEGVDLKDDASRFQILCKVPYPFLLDNLIVKRMKKFKHWYPYKTAKTIIQSLGRSIRHKDDIAISYILDEDWEFFYKINKKMFPTYFKKSLQ